MTTTVTDRMDGQFTLTCGDCGHEGQLHEATLNRAPGVRCSECGATASRRDLVTNAVGMTRR